MSIITTELTVSLALLPFWLDTVRVSMLSLTITTVSATLISWKFVVQQLLGTIVAKSNGVAAPKPQGTIKGSANGRESKEATLNDDGEQLPLENWTTIHRYL
jgi:hypothetical protein